MSEQRHTGMISCTSKDGPITASPFPLSQSNTVHRRSILDRLPWQTMVALVTSFLTRTDRLLPSRTSKASVLVHACVSDPQSPEDDAGELERIR